MEFSGCLDDWQIIDRGDAAAHQAFNIKLPIFIAVRTEPMAAVVVPFIGEPHGYSVFMKGPQFLDQTIIQFFGPFTEQEGFN